MKQSFLRILLPPLIALIVVTLVWEAAVRFRSAEASGYVIPLPLPSGMMGEMISRRGEMVGGLETTAIEALLGFLASGILGSLAAIVMSTSVWVRRAVYPYTLFFQTVPVIAIAPMLEIWSGAGLRAVVIMAFIVSVFPVIAGALDGLLSTEPALEDLFQLYGSSGWQRLWKLRLPSALPSMLVGLRVAAGLSVIGAVVAEFFVGTYGADEGLGVQIVSNAKYGHVDAVFAGVILASLLGLGMFAGVNVAGRILLRHRRAAE